MLASALFYVALVAVIATTFLSAGLAMTRMTVHRLSQTYVTPGYQRAVSALQQTLATDMQNGGLPNPLPAFTPIPASCVDASTPCRFRTAETITLTQTSTPAPVAACDSSQSACAANEQANAYVNESRVSARITVSVIAGDGTTLTTRSGDVIMRTMNTPPYVVVGGARDGAFDSVASANAAGDDGGTVPATPNPCSANAPGTVDDTVVRVAYRNQTTNACSDGSSWRAASYTSGSGVPSGWSP